MSNDSGSQREEWRRWLDSEIRGRIKSGATGAGCLPRSDRGPRSNDWLSRYNYLLNSIVASERAADCAIVGKCAATHRANAERSKLHLEYHCTQEEVVQEVRENGALISTKKTWRFLSERSHEEPCKEST